MRYGAEHGVLSLEPNTKEEEQRGPELEASLDYTVKPCDQGRGVAGGGETRKRQTSGEREWKCVMFT